MRILLCAATSFEIQPTIELAKQKHWQHQVANCITGVGLTAATYSIAKAIFAEKPDLIIQAGIAGCFDENLPLGKTVVVETETLGDAGVLENGNFKSLFDLNLIADNDMPWQKKQLPNLKTDLIVHTGLLKVSGVSVNEITTNTERINYLKNNLGAVVESMEGSALHYVALQENTPFLQLRSLSNYVGERDKEKWKLAEAIQSLNTELQQILSKIIDQ